MIDVNTTLRTAYFNALNNTITVNGSNVPFYDQVPSGAAYPYIFTSGFTSKEKSTKDEFGYDITVTLAVAMKYPANYGGQSDVDTIVTGIQNKIRGTTTTSYPLSLGPNFQMVNTYLDGTSFNRVDQSDGVYFYRTIRFRHFITQYNN